MSQLVPTLATSAYAIKDHVYLGKQYLAGETWPIAQFDAEAVRRMHTARRIEYGTAPERMAKVAADRRAKMAADAAAAPKPPDMTEAELEAATAPKAPAVQRGGKQR